MQRKKVLFLAFLFLLFGANLSAQDLIFKHNGDVIEAKVIEVAPDYITYKLASLADGPNFKIPASDVHVIRFKNGHIEKVRSNRADNYFALAPGFGGSYAGLGLSFEYFISSQDINFSIQGGLGITNYGLGFSLAPKLFLIEKLYLSPTYIALPDRYYYQGYVDEFFTDGIFFMLGYDLYFGKVFGINLGIGPGLTEKSFLWDIGLKFRF